MRSMDTKYDYIVKMLLDNWIIAVIVLDLKTLSVNNCY